MPLKEVLTVYLPLVQEFVYDGLTKFAQSRFDVLQAHVDGFCDIDQCKPHNPVTKKEAAVTRQGPQDSAEPHPESCAPSMSCVSAP